MVIPAKTAVPEEAVVQRIPLAVLALKVAMAEQERQVAAVPEEAVAERLGLLAEILEVLPGPPEETERQTQSPALQLRMLEAAAVEQTPLGIMVAQAGLAVVGAAATRHQIIRLALPAFRGLKDWAEEEAAQAV